MKPHFRFLVSSVLISVLLTGNLNAQTPSHAALIEGAKKEGKLVWYTSMAIDTSKPLLDAFQKDYPFIKAELVRAGEEQLMNRVLSETRAGRWLFDAISTAAMSVVADRHMVAPYLTPERDAFLSEFKDPQGYWTGIFVNNLVLCYNTKMIGAKDAPKNYPDLLDPKWKDKMLMDSTDYDWFGTLVTVWGKEKTVQYMKRLATQNPLWRRGHGLTAQLLGAGEVPLAWAYNFRAERMKSEGAPKLLIDFATSKKGQQMVRGMRRIPARSDIEPLAPKMDQTKLKLKAVPKDVYLHFDDYAREFRQIFGL